MIFAGDDEDLRNKTCVRGEEEDSYCRWEKGQTLERDWDMYSMAYFIFSKEVQYCLLKKINRAVVVEE